MRVLELLKLLFKMYLFCLILPTFTSIEKCFKICISIVTFYIDTFDCVFLFNKIHPYFLITHFFSIGSTSVFYAKKYDRHKTIYHDTKGLLNGNISFLFYNAYLQLIQFRRICFLKSGDLNSSLNIKYFQNDVILNNYKIDN